MQRALLLLDQESVLNVARVIMREIGGENRRLNYSSLCTMAGEKAGTQTEIYSAPSSSGVP